ncbi:MAG: PstS family phosphate ABC transporter substrate-binding protein [Bacteriovoracia bacterium]
MNQLNLLVASLVVAVGTAQAAPVPFQGSDTLAGVMTDAINAAGMEKEIVYLGGGSGKGELALANEEQGIAPMSREAKPEVADQAAKKGIKLVGHVVALDALSIFVNGSNKIARMDLPTVKAIFECTITKWEQVAGSGKAGTITVYRRNDASGTTDAFKHFTAIKKFGNCVTVLAETADIAEKTSKDADAIGYSGASGKRDGNRAVPLAATAEAKAVEANVKTVRDFSYPMARKLYVYEAVDAKTDKTKTKTKEVEEKLLQNLLDRSFLDPIVQDHEFYTID